MDQQFLFIHMKWLFSSSVLLVCGSWLPCPSLLLTSSIPEGRIQTSLLSSFGLPTFSRPWRSLFTNAPHSGIQAYRCGWGTWQKDYKRHLGASSGIICSSGTTRPWSQHAGQSCRAFPQNTGMQIQSTAWAFAFRLLQDQTALAIMRQRSLHCICSHKSYPSQPGQSWHHLTDLQRMAWKFH